MAAIPSEALILLFCCCMEGLLLRTLLGSIMSGVTEPSGLSDPGVGPRLLPVSISSASLRGVRAGEGRAEAGLEPGCCPPAGILSRSPAVAAG